MEIKSKFDLIKHFGKLGFKVAAEIGVAEGYFSEFMCQNIPGLKLYCVDVWKPYRGNRWSGSHERNEHHFAKACEVLSQYNTTILREMSMDAARMIPNNSLDFVYIDSNHSFDYAMEDLITWSRKVRPGGIVCGDDYYPMEKGGVVEAVDAYTKAHGIVPIFTTPDCRDRGGMEQPNYYWTKSI